MSRLSIRARLFWLAFLLLAIQIAATGFFTYQVVNSAQAIDSYTAIRTSIIAGSVALLASSVLIAFIVWSITGSLRLVERSAADLASGKLDVILPASSADEVGAMTRALAALRDRFMERDRLEQLLRRTEAATAQAHAWLQDTIETISEGLALYDAQDRLVICNGRYKEMVAAAGVGTLPGPPREAVLRFAGEDGDVRSDARMGQRRVERRERRRVADRWIDISERATTDGGKVVVLTDITEQQLDASRVPRPELSLAPRTRADTPTEVERAAGAEDEILTRIVSVLSQSFRRLAAEELRALAAVSSWLSIPGGGCLFEQGTESDSVYVVASGLLGAYRMEADGQEKLLGRIGVSETIGEMGFLTTDPRTATIRALRSSELVRIARDDLPDLVFAHPMVLTELCSTVVYRLRNAQERGLLPLNPKTFCIVPHDPSIDARKFAACLAGVPGSNPLILSKRDSGGNTAHWFFEHEQKHNPIVYLADPKLNAWTRFCLRQADQVVLLAGGESDVRPFAALGQEHHVLPADIACDLVLLWDRPISGAKTAAWLELVKPRAHYHVRTPADGARAARLITRRATGLVLSGGGAKGFAHLGVLRALKEHGIGIDAIGGASMGALIGAGVALEWDIDAMLADCVEGFLRRPYLSDIGISRSALSSGKKLRRLFDQWFGDARIEETPIKYYCVSTNLTEGTLSVHTSGRLSHWVRASAAMPGMFPPIVNDGVVHVDGGVLDSLPVDVMRGLGVERVIGVDVRSDEALVAGVRPPPLLKLLKRVATIGSDSKFGSYSKKCDILITPNMQHVGLLDWRGHEKATEAGYRAAVERLTALGYTHRSAV